MTVSSSVETFLPRAQLVQPVRRVAEGDALVRAIGVFLAALETLSEVALAPIAYTVSGFLARENVRKGAPACATSRRCARADCDEGERS